MTPPPFDPCHKWLGIPPAEQPPTLYRLLGLAAFEADGDVIDAAANRQMAFLRTCANGPHAADSQRLLTAVAAARLCLLDPAKKAAYDSGLRSTPAAAAWEEARFAVGRLHTAEEPPARPPAGSLVPVRAKPSTPRVVMAAEVVEAAGSRPRLRGLPDRRGRGRRVPRPLLFVGGAVGLTAVVLAVGLWAVQRSTAKIGTLVVDVDQPGAEVSVDGHVVTGAGDRGPTRAEVTEGPRQVRVAKAGFVTFTQDVPVEGGGTVTVRVTLEPVRVAAGPRVQPPTAGTFPTPPAVPPPGHQTRPARPVAAAVSQADDAPRHHTDRRAAGVAGRDRRGEDGGPRVARRVRRV